MYTFLFFIVRTSKKIYFDIINVQLHEQHVY